MAIGGRHRHVRPGGCKCPCRPRLPRARGRGAMSVADEVGAFAARMSWSDLPPPVSEALRGRVLDSLGCAVGAIGADVVRSVRAVVDALGGWPRCTLVGGGSGAPD